MDKNRVKKICESILDTSYGGITIKNLDLFPTHKYNNGSGKWETDSFALYIQLNLVTDLSYTSHKVTEIQSTIEGVLGFECCVDFF